MKKSAVVLLACLLGCNHLPRPVSEASDTRPASQPGAEGPAETAEPRQLAELVSYAQRVARQRPEDQRRELGMASQAYAKERSPYSRIRLALLQSLPGTALYDPARALAALEGVATGAGPLAQFAAFLQAQLAEHVREQRRAAQLKEQLDALRALERSLMERGQGK